MAHKTLIDGTAYNVVGGSTLIDGTAASIVQGNTLIDGSGYTIPFKSIPSFDWGDEQGNADEAWWASLSEYIGEYGAQESWVGKTKMVTPTFPIVNSSSTSSYELGSHLVRCIGVNQDADKTATFDMVEVSPIPDNQYFNDGGTYRTDWNNIYYEAFPGRKYIAPIQKYYNLGSSSKKWKRSSRYDYVWSLSIDEIGLEYDITSFTNYQPEYPVNGTYPYTYYAQVSGARIKTRLGQPLASGEFWNTRTKYNPQQYHDTAVMHIDNTGRNYNTWGGGYKDYSVFTFAIGGQVYFDWGKTNVIADAQWFADLKAYLANNPAEDGWVGKEKTVTLSSAVLGTTTHKIRCIGVNQDGDRTATFQTSDLLADITRFGSSNAQWIGSTARTQCQNYYNAFPGKASIKTVSKGTCPDTNDSREGTAVYNDETVWLLSEREIAETSYAPISPGWSGMTMTNAECAYGYKVPYRYYTQAFPYYSSSDKYRLKQREGSSSSNGYWLRSRYYKSTNPKEVCVITGGGGAYHYDYDWDGMGFAPAFVIGN